MLLDMMRRHDVAMWIVVNEEYHDDPLTEFVAPPLPYGGGRDLFVFIDAGEAGLRRVAVTGYADEHVRQFFESPDDPRPAKEVLPELIAEHEPATIALSTGGHRGVTRSLTLSSYEWLSEIVGPEASSRFVSAADLIEEYLNTRIPEELGHYTWAVELTAELSRRVFSNEVVEPGTTTVGDLRRWLFDRYAEHAEDRQAMTLRAGSYLAVELNTASEIPEWDGQTVWIMEEDPAYLTDQGWQFFVPRQETFLLIE